jgi:hypothetical protein
LFIAKYQINPLINILADSGFLHHFSHFGNKKIGIIPGPLGKFNIIDPFLGLHDPKILLINIEIKLRQRIHLGQQLPHIGMLGNGIPPGIPHRVKQPISKIKPATLQQDPTLRKGIQPNQKMINNSR